MFNCIYVDILNKKPGRKSPEWSLPSEVMQVVKAGLTVSVDVSQLIVHVEEAPEALLDRGHWPVTRQHIFVKLEVLGGLCQVQKPRSLVEHHGDYPSLDTSQLLNSGSFLAIYILQQGPGLATRRHRGGLLGMVVPVCIVRWVISRDVQPVALAKWHAFSPTNQHRVLIPKPG